MNSRIHIQHFLPAQPCVLCGSLTQAGVWCADCDADLPRSGKAHCPVCALPTPTGTACGQCLQHAPSFDLTVAAFTYAFPIDKLIQAMKFSAQLQLAARLADELIPHLTTTPDFLIAMPLHNTRLRERGFNQSQLLAKHLAQRTGIPLLNHACARTRNTSPQSTLSWQEREKNMHQAFTCSLDLSGKHIALVDDVMTTGASIEALANTVRRAGAQQISAWVIARTLPHEKITT